MLVCAKDPGIRPTNTLAKLTNRNAIPPLFIMIPANTKSGIANMVKSSIPVTIR